jgi:hypothetical protein
MFRTIFGRVYGLVNSFRQRLRILAGKPAPVPANPQEARLQRRLEKSKQRVRTAKKRPRKARRR